MGHILSPAYAALHAHQPLPRGPYPTAKWPAGLTHLEPAAPVAQPAQRDPDRFSGAPEYSTWEAAQFARDIEARSTPNAEDLCNEIDEDICAALLKLIDAGRDEDAGRALRIVRDALHRRLIARGWGDAPKAEDGAMAALTAAGLA